MDLTAAAIIGIIVLLVLMLLGMNIGLAMMAVGFVGYGLVMNWGAAFGLL